MSRLSELIYSLMNWCFINYFNLTDNSVTSDMPAELLEIFPDEGQPGTKRPKDRVCTNNSSRFFLKGESSV